MVCAGTMGGNRALNFAGLGFSVALYDTRARQICAYGVEKDGGKHPMQNVSIRNATVFVIFGGGGDLTWRKLVPALYSLFLDGRLSDRFEILGVGRKQMANDSYRRHLREGVDKFSSRGKTDEKSWDEFASHISFSQTDLNDPRAFDALSGELSAYDEK